MTAPQLFPWRNIDLSDGLSDHSLSTGSQTSFDQAVHARGRVQHRDNRPVGREFVDTAQAERPIRAAVALIALKAFGLVGGTAMLGICLGASMVTAVSIYTAVALANRPMGRVFQLGGIAAVLGIAGPAAAVAHFSFNELQGSCRWILQVSEGQRATSAAALARGREAALTLRCFALKRTAQLVLWTFVVRPLGTHALFATPPAAGALERACTQMLMGVYFGLYASAAMIVRD